MFDVERTRDPRAPGKARMIFDDEDDLLSLDEHETFEQPSATLACPVCGHAVGTITLGHPPAFDPCEHVILSRHAGETTWLNHRLAPKFRAPDDDLSIDAFLDREGIAWQVEEKEEITVYFNLPSEL